MDGRAASAAGSTVNGGRDWNSLNVDSGEIPVFLVWSILNAQDTSGRGWPGTTRWIGGALAPIVLAEDCHVVKVMLICEIVPHCAGNPTVGPFQVGVVWCNRVREPSKMITIRYSTVN